MSLTLEDKVTKCRCTLKVRMRRIRTLLCLSFTLLMLSGCGASSSVMQETAEAVSETEALNETEAVWKAGNIEKKEIYERIYEEALSQREETDLETIRNVVQLFGEAGYPAVDSENQINMVCAERVEAFCSQVEAGEEAETVIIEVSYQGGFTEYAFETREGAVNVIRTYFLYQDGVVEEVSKREYPAYAWQYTEEGYLLFEEYHMEGYDGPSGRTAFRVQPLEEACRELNRQYILSVGYAENNLFLIDWNEKDYGEVDFYDMFDILYEKVYGRAMPYAASENCGMGMRYQIPEEEFETVIMSYFKIDSRVLRSKTSYHENTQTYEYRPRGLYDCEVPETPYPEVVAYERYSDGMLNLTVNVVYPNRNTSKAYVHEVVVRTAADGSFQYVSNTILTSKDNEEGTWHVDRLTEEEWEELYGETEEGSITETEKRQLQAAALSAAGQVKTLYEDAEITEEASGLSYIQNFTDRKCKEVVTCLGKAGVVSVAKDINMENYGEVEDFYRAYIEKRDAMVTIFEVYQDGRIAAVTFIYRGEKIQSYYVGIGWQSGGIPEITEAYVSDIKEMKLTGKGYFIYAHAVTIAHGNLREYYRIQPLTDKCRALTKKYLSGLSYIDYNVLTTNWDSSNVEAILMPRMFADIYRMAIGEQLVVDNDRIPADVYENVLTTYFPVSQEVLRSKCGYDAESQSYPYEQLFSSPYQPFGEVIAYTENADGTITLTVDGVWADYNSDCAFTNQIVVQPLENGAFRYLSNTIEQKEMEIPLIE